MTTSTDQRILVTVDADHLKAWLRLTAGANATDLTPGEVSAALEAAKVAVDDAVVARITNFVELAKRDEVGPEPSLIAEGRPPQEGRNGKFVRAESPEEQEADNEDDRIDYRTFNVIRTVEKEEVIGKVVPPVPGKPGLDVHGNELQTKTRLEPVKVAANVRLAEDGQTAIAESAGRVFYEAGELRIRPVVEIAGDVDFESGNVDATTDVSIRGTVRDLFEVTSRKGVTVGGAVEAARVVAQEDIVVRGGILGRFKGVVRAGKRIIAKFCDEAHLRAQDDIQITREAINSHLHTMGRFVSDRAAVIGGEVYAREGVTVRTIGSDACVHTRVSVGIHARVFKKARQLETECKKQQESVDKIRNLVKPLMDDVKRLAPAQKEQATELLYQADELELSIKAKQAEQEEMIQSGRPDSPACIEVQDRICQNASIAIDGREVVFHKELKGPVKIEQRKVKNVTEIVAINTLTASVITLNSSEIDLDAVPDEEEDPFERAKAAQDTPKPS